MTMELFKLATGVGLVHVAYKGGAPALQDVMGGHIPTLFGNLPEQLGAIKAGRTRAIAVSSAKPTPPCRTFRPSPSRVSRIRRQLVVRTGRAGEGAEADTRQAERRPGEDPQAPGDPRKFAEQSVEVNPRRAKSSPPGSRTRSPNGRR